MDRDKPVPLNCRRANEGGCKQDCAQPPELKAPSVLFTQGPLCQHDRHTAAEQTDRWNDRRLQHFTGGRAGQTLADIKEVAATKIENRVVSVRISETIAAFRLD